MSVMIDLMENSLLPDAVIRQGIRRLFVIPVFGVRRSIYSTNLTGTVAGPSTGGSHGCTYPAQSHQATGTFNANARVIELEYSWASYESKYHCVNMLGAPSNCCLLCDEVCDGAVISATQNVALRLTPNGR